MDKAKLTAKRHETASGFPERDVTIPGVGTVRVRGLSRREVMRLREDRAPETYEQRLVAAALVDPVMSVAEVGQWQDAGLAGEFRDVTDAIVELSGLGDGAPKSGVQGDGGRS